MEALADVARRYEIVLLSDEIYGELHHDGLHLSLARFYPEGTIISSGLSKWCGAGGWRLGTFAFPRELDWLLDAMATVASETYTATSAPIQYAAVRAFQGGSEIESYLVQSRRVLKQLGNEIAQRLTQAGIHVLPPEGGFYLFLDFSPCAENLKARGITDSIELCERLLAETGVAILPGSDFGREASGMTVRIAYVDFDGARALALAGQSPISEPLGDDVLEAACTNQLTAIDRMIHWLAG